MSLNTEERKTLMALYWNKSVAALEDAQSNIENKRWNTAANRMYYALLHALNALFVKDGINVGTHKGAKALFGQNYVINGRMPIEDAHFLSRMETMRDKADYDCTFTASQNDVENNLPHLLSMLNRIEVLLNAESYV